MTRVAKLHLLSKPSSLSVINDMVMVMDINDCCMVDLWVTLRLSKHVVPVKVAEGIFTILDMALPNIILLLE